MRIRLLLAGLAAGIALVAQPAAAEDYFTVLNRMAGLETPVTGQCELRAGGTLLNLADTASNAYISVRVAEQNASRVQDACNAGGPATLLLRFSPQDDIGSYSEALAPADAGGALSVTQYLDHLNAEAASITSITGRIRRENEGLSEVYLDGEGFSVSLMVSLTHMPVRTAIDYLIACFEVCDHARFDLRPIQFVTYGGWTVRQATGWSRVKRQ